MMMTTRTTLTALYERLVGQGHRRTVKAKKNILGMFVFRGITAASNFFIVPLALNYLNPTRYGIWLTLTSIIGWVNFLDVGLGNGLRNKLAESIAAEDPLLARTYVSTTYAVIGIIVLSLLVLFLAVNPLLSWSKILNADATMEHELTLLATVVAAAFLARLLFGLVGTVLLALQRPAMSSSIEALVGLCSLGSILLLVRLSLNSLFWFGLCVGAVAAGVPLLANLWLFTGEYRYLAPSRRTVDFSYARRLMKLGIQFFVLQLAGLLLFSTANIVITQLFGPSEVTPYNIVFKYYGIASLGFSIILAPFWSAYTEAFVNRDNDWILRSTKKLKKVWLVLLLVLVVMTAASDHVYRLWVGRDLGISLWLSVLMAVYTAIVAWSNIFVYFINATGKIRLQLWVAIIVSVLNIPLAIMLASTLGLRSVGVIAAACIALLPGCLIAPLQMKKIISGSASGIWAR